MALQIAPFESSDCITSTYGTLVQHFGGQPAIFGSQWGFRPGTNNDFDWPFERLNASRRTPCELMSDWYGLDVVWTRHPDWDPAWAQVRATLAGGQPVIVIADAFHLPYCWQYQKQHSPHRIVLTGHGRDFVDTIDGYRGSLHRGRLALDALRAAVTSSGLLYPRRMYVDGRYTVITVSAPVRPLPDAVAPRTRESLVENISQYVPDGDTDGDSGHDLLRRCSAELRANAPELAARTTTDVSEVSAWFGGIASQRALNSIFLHWAAETLCMPALHQYADQATALARRWLKLRNYLYLRLTSQSRANATADAGAAVRRVADIIEENAGHELSWCGAMGDRLTDVDGRIPAADTAFQRPDR